MKGGRNRGQGVKEQLCVAGRAESALENCGHALHMGLGFAGRADVCMCKLLGWGRGRWAEGSGASVAVCTFGGGGLGLWLGLERCQGGRGAARGCVVGIAGSCREKVVAPAENKATGDDNLPF